MIKQQPCLVCGDSSGHGGLQCPKLTVSATPKPEQAQGEAEFEKLTTALISACQWDDCGYENELQALRTYVQRLQHELASKQAQIDALMLEHCPDEMTAEQLEEWGAHQSPAAGEVPEELLNQWTGEWLKHSEADQGQFIANKAAAWGAAQQREVDVSACERKRADLNDPHDLEIQGYNQAIDDCIEAIRDQGVV